MCVIRLHLDSQVLLSMLECYIYALRKLEAYLEVFTAGLFQHLCKCSVLRIPRLFVKEQDAVVMTGQGGSKSIMDLCRNKNRVRVRVASTSFL